MPGDPRRRRRATKQLRERGHHAERGLAEGRPGRPGPRASRGPSRPSSARDLLDPAAGLGDRLVVTGQERGAHGVRPAGRQLEVRRPRAGTRRGPAAGSRRRRPSWLGARGTSVVEVAQRGEGLRHDVVAGDAGQGGHERHAARVVLDGGGRRALGRGRNGVLVKGTGFSRRRQLPEATRESTRPAESATRCCRNRASLALGRCAAAASDRQGTTLARADLPRLPAGVAADWCYVGDSFGGQGSEAVLGLGRGLRRTPAPRGRRRTLLARRSHTSGQRRTAPARSTR